MFGIGCLTLAIFTITFDPIVKLEIWAQFNEDIPYLPPLLAIIASLGMILSPIAVVIGVVKRNQIIIIIVSIYRSCLFNSVVNPKSSNL